MAYEVTEPAGLMRLRSANSSSFPKRWTSRMPLSSRSALLECRWRCDMPSGKGGVHVSADQQQRRSDSRERPLHRWPVVGEQPLLDEADGACELLRGGRIALGNRVHHVSRYQVRDEAVRSVVAPGVGHLVEVVLGEHEEIAGRSGTVEVGRHRCPVRGHADVGRGEHRTVIGGDRSGHEREPRREHRRADRRAHRRETKSRAMQS